MDNIKAIIFDLGNVLVDFNHRIAAERISAYCDKSGEEIYNLFFDSQLTRSFEEGKVLPADFFLNVKSALDLKLDFDKFVPIWNEIFFLSDKNNEVFKLIKVLKKNYRLLLLSNINELHWEYLEKKFPIFGDFHFVIPSYRTGLTKPDPLIYQKALESLKVLPGQAFYTDDRMDLIEKAREIGIRSFQFVSAEKLKEDLRGQGVITQ